MNSNEFDDDNEDTASVDMSELAKLIRPTVKPFWPGFILSVMLNFLLGPLLLWRALTAAGVWPATLWGYLSIVSFVALMRLCVLDKGLAEMIYVPVGNNGDTNG